MPIVVYRNYSTSTSAAQVTATVVRDGRLLGVRIHGGIVAAAGTTLFLAEAAVNIGTTLNYTTNNPDRKSAVATQHAVVIAATAMNHDTGFVPCDCPVKAADVLTLSISHTTTTPTSSTTGAEWFVEEKA